VKASYKSPYGLISSEWKKDNGGFYLKVKIPANTHATIYLPSKASSNIRESGHMIKNKIFKNDRAIIEIGSGSYSYQVDQL
jgi:alpha-L-rhamnosidase